MANIFTKIARAGGFGTLTKSIRSLFDRNTYTNGFAHAGEKLVVEPWSDEIDAVKDLFKKDDTGVNSAQTESNNGGIRINADGSVDFSNIQSLDQLGGAALEAITGALPQATRMWNTAEAQKERDWQTEMSNTAYQRSRADLEAAGLNPILAYSQGGASSGSGAVASSTPSSASSIGPMLQGIGNIINAVMSADNRSDALQQKAAMDLMKFEQKNSAQSTDRDYKNSYVALNNARTAILRNSKPAEVKKNIIIHKNK